MLFLEMLLQPFRAAESAVANWTHLRKMSNVTMTEISNLFGPKSQVFCILGSFETFLFDSTCTFFNYSMRILFMNS